MNFDRVPRWFLVVQELWKNGRPESITESERSMFSGRLFSAQVHSASFSSRVSCCAWALLQLGLHVRSTCAVVSLASCASCCATMLTMKNPLPCFRGKNNTLPYIHLKQQRQRNLEVMFTSVDRRNQKDRSMGKNAGSLMDLPRGCLSSDSHASLQHRGVCLTLPPHRVVSLANSAKRPEKGAINRIQIPPETVKPVARRNWRMPADGRVSVPVISLSKKRLTWMIGTIKHQTSKSI